MTDVKLLPVELPSCYQFTRQEVRAMMTDYARANVSHATAPLHAAIERLRAEVESLHVRGIHTCHDQCQRPLCVAQRENAELRSQRDMLAEALREALESGDDGDWQSARGVIVEALARASQPAKEPGDGCG